MKRMMTKKMFLFVVLSLLATLSLAAQASAAQFDPVLTANATMVRR